MTPPRGVRSGGKPGFWRRFEGEGGCKTWRRIRSARPGTAWGSGPGLQVEIGRASGGGPQGKGGGGGGRFPGPPSPALRPTGRWPRRFPGSPAPDAAGGAFRPSPTRLSPAGAGAGEAGRAGSGGAKARGRRLRGAGGGGGGEDGRRAGRRRAGRGRRRRRRRRGPCRTQLQAGRPRRLRDAARPWRDGDLTGAQAQRAGGHVAGAVPAAGKCG